MGSGADVYHFGEEIASFTTTTPFATSNQAEFIAGIDALNLATYFCPHNVCSLLVFGDSEIIIKGLQNNSPPKNPLLLPLHLRLKALVDSFPGDVTLVHVKRALNKRADALAHTVSISDDAGFVMRVTPGTQRPTVINTHPPPHPLPPFP